MRPFPKVDGGRRQISTGEGGQTVAGRTYDVSPDGQRFLMIKDNASGDQTTTPASMVVVLNCSRS